MKKYVIMMLTMLAGWEHVMGDNTLSVKDVLLPQGGTVTVEIGMDNTDNITALQFEIGRASCRERV